MLAAFIGWNACALIFIGFAIWARKTDKPAGFWANAEPPKIKDVKAYNKVISNLWLIFTVLYVACGLPLLFAEENTGLAFLCMLIIPVIVGIMIAYTFIEEKYKEK